MKEKKPKTFFPRHYTYKLEPSAMLLLYRPAIIKYISLSIYNTAIYLSIDTSVLVKYIIMIITPSHRAFSLTHLTLSLSISIADSIFFLLPATSAVKSSANDGHISPPRKKISPPVRIVYFCFPSFHPVSKWSFKRTTQLPTRYTLHVSTYY